MPNDTAPAQWNGKPENPEVDGWHWLLIEGWSDMPEPRWWDATSQTWGVMKPAEPSRIKGIWKYLEPCLTPSEHHQRTLAASAAAWIAAREAAVRIVNETEFPASGGEAEHDACADFAGDVEAALLSTHPPADAAAALAEVVRVAKREAFEEAALMLDEKATDLQRQHGIGPDSFCVVTLRAKAAAIRARSEGEGA